MIMTINKKDSNELLSLVDLSSLGENHSDLIHLDWVGVNLSIFYST